MRACDVEMERGEMNSIIIKYSAPLALVIMAACSRPVEIDISENWKVKRVDKIGRASCRERV